LNNILSILWRYAYSDKPIISNQSLQCFTPQQRTCLVEQNFLRKTNNAASILVGGQSFEIMYIVTSDGAFKPCYMDEYGFMHWLQPDEIHQYLVDFAPIAECIYDGLQCRGVIGEPLPGKVWKVGSAGQQTREVYLVRNWAGDISVQQQLWNAKDGSLVFYIGSRPDEFRIGKHSSSNSDTSGGVMEAQYYAVDDLMSFDEEGEISFDGETVHNNLKDIFASRPQRKRERRAVGKQESATEKIQNSLWEMVDSMLELARRGENGEELTERVRQAVCKVFPTQKELAARIGVADNKFSRTISVWKEDKNGFGRLFLKMLELMVRPQTKANPNPEYQQIDKINDFYQDNREQIERLRKLHPHPSIS